MAGGILGLRPVGAYYCWSAEFKTFVLGEGVLTHSMFLDVFDIRKIAVLFGSWKELFASGFTWISCDLRGVIPSLEKQFKLSTPTARFSG